MNITRFSNHMIPILSSGILGSLGSHFISGVSPLQAAISCILMTGINRTGHRFKTTFPLKLTHFVSLLTPVILLAPVNPIHMLALEISVYCANFFIKKWLRNFNLNTKHPHQPITIPSEQKNSTSQSLPSADQCDFVQALFTQGRIENDENFYKLMTILKLSQKNDWKDLKRKCDYVIDNLLIDSLSNLEQFSHCIKILQESQIESLNLLNVNPNSTTITQRHLELISSLKSLKNLTLGKCNELDWHLLSQLSHLKEFALFSSETLLTETQISCLPKALESLDLGVARLTDEGLKSLTLFPFLTNVCLRGNLFTSNESISFIPSFLTSLTITHNDQVADHHLLFLTSFKALKYLEVSWCSLFLEKNRDIFSSSISSLIWKFNHLPMKNRVLS